MVSRVLSLACKVHYCACIEFRPSEHLRHAFHSSQLIKYRLEPNPDAADDKDIPLQRLALAFSTAGVMVLRWRLGHLTVRVVSKRYAEMDRHAPFVASITITPIAKATAGKG